MDSASTAPNPVVAALRDRLHALDVQRDALARRVRDLEAALADASQEAQRRASEAVQLQALLDFYESDAVPAAVSTALAPVPAATPLPQLRQRLASPPAETAAVGPAADAEPSDDAAAAAIAAAAKAASGRGKTGWAAAWRDAAITALRDHGAPMHYRDLYRVLAGRGFVFGGKSPEATFLASLHRERTTFQSAGKGTYWLVEAAHGAPAAVDGRARRRARRPRPIGRVKGG